ncbi:MAG: chemotaxis-specific protein-glutamate methyltransferase CheB [Kofleriaceae bacterium]
MIRVLVVDDSITVRERLVEILSSDPEFAVVGQASDGRRAVELVARLKPDVITLDIVMPDMTGLEATEHIMAHQPTPILVVSSSFNRGELFDTYAALAAGAVDVLEKPRLEDVEWERRFLAAVRLVSRIKVITHPRARLGTLGRTRAPSLRGPQLDLRNVPRPIDVVAIGASTGGPGALATVLGAIGQGFPLPILVILHLDAQFAGAFADWLGQQIRVPVRLAHDGELLDQAAGQVRLAPADVHLGVQGRRIRLVASPPRNHCRPSVDVLFESLAAEPALRAAACVLTGMGRDGAAGLLAIRRAGGFTVAQDEATSVIYGMPREAVLLGGVDRELPLGEIGPLLDGLRRGPA